MNSYLKRALVRFLQPTIDELVQAAIDRKEEDIDKMAEEAVESCIDGAGISKSVEDEINDQVRNYNFDHEIENAIKDRDIDKIIEEKVEEAVEAEEIDEQVTEAVNSHNWTNALDGFDFITPDGQVLTVRLKGIK